MNRLLPWVQRWEHADEDVVQLTGPHSDAAFHDYLAWYQPRTRSRLTYADTHPQPHIASMADAYPYHRDEALAGAVSYMFQQRLHSLHNFCGNEHHCYVIAGIGSPSIGH